jgi:hypothetical protein
MASIKCPKCGLVNFASADACRRCKTALGMGAEQAVAPGNPAATRIIVGPVFTKAGFKSWHLVCLPDAMVAVPQGTIDGFMTSVGANPVGAMLGGLAGALLVTKGSKVGTKAMAALELASEEHLRSDPQHVVYSIRELRSIVLKKPLFSNPEIRVEGPDQGITVYGITDISAYSAVSTRLQSAYPRLFRVAT